MRKGLTIKEIRSKPPEDRRDIYKNLKIIEETVIEKLKGDIYCPITEEQLFKLEGKKIHKAVVTSALCYECKDYYRYDQTNRNFEKGSWPVAYLGEGILCKKCMKEES